MTLAFRTALAAAASLTLVACGQDAAQAPAEPVVLKEAMNEIVTRQNDLVNVLIEALDDRGEVDPAKLTEERWATIAASTAALRQAGAALRDGEISVVAAPGETIEGEGTPGALSAAEVQARIDADLDGFRAHAETLAGEFEALAAASEARDAGTLWNSVLDLDPLCAPCHTQYWYPETTP
jgi:hypothetical protein